MQVSTLAKIVDLLGKLGPSVIPHVADFVEALVNKDEDAAKRAATSAATDAIWSAPVKR
jgi:hypothetical protein